jgi:hypothetical protein
MKTLEEQKKAGQAAVYYSTGKRTPRRACAATLQWSFTSLAASKPPIYHLLKTE